MDENQLVEVGQPLLEIAPSDYVVSVVLREAGLRNVMSEKKELAVQIVVMERELSRAQAALAGVAAGADQARKDRARFQGLLQD